MRSRTASYALLLLAFIPSVLLAQQYRAGRLPVQPSTFVAQVKALKKAKPNITPTELAEAANGILDKSGIPFAMFFQPAVCEKLAKAIAERKDPNAKVTIGATLKSVEADGAGFTLPEPVMGAAGCGCYVELPILQVTPKDFIAVVSGRNIRFHLPIDLTMHEARLIDDNDKTITKRTWRIPFRAIPIGVSYDENVVYLPFEDSELAELSLMIFGEGVFQVGTRAEADEGGKGKLAPATTGSPRTITFPRWGKSYTVSFREPCR
ncbi:MAG TPA: hypothetical protein VNA22_02730 [Pyrinomonadaceae bacterium]|nr:hypothetical protein [Pyrinomonadaceae bacterium]